MLSIADQIVAARRAPKIFPGSGLVRPSPGVEKDSIITELYPIAITFMVGAVNFICKHIHSCSEVGWNKQT
jgi:hypothetical protein